MTAPDFPLLKLPYLGQRHILLTMTTEEKILYSLLSKNAKKLVQSLPKQVEDLEFTISNNSLYIESDLDSHIYLRWEPATREYQEKNWGTIQLPEKPTIGVDDKDPIMPEFTLRDWVVHMTDVLRCKKIKLSFEKGSDCYDLNSIQNLFQGLEILKITVLCVGENTCKIVEKFDSVKDLHLIYRHSTRRDQPLVDHLVTRPELDSIYVVNISINVNDLLRLDSKSIMLQRRYYNKQELNELLKQWTTGNALGNLEILDIRTSFDINKDVQHNLLNGINYTTVPRDQHKMLKLDTWVVDYSKSVADQYEIQRTTDGMKATIQISRMRRETHSTIFVGK